MKKNLALIILFFIIPFITIAQGESCFGESIDLKLGRTTPYSKIKIDSIEGYFLLDFGTTGSTIDINNFINGTPEPSNNSSNEFEKFHFFGNWGPVSLNQQNHSNIIGLKNFKQAGIIGTDFLSLNIFTIDYENNLLHRANKENFCSNDKLERLGFKAASTRGYYSNDLQELNNKCTVNIPTIPINFGNISAVAQIDPGYDDAIYRNSININKALFEALQDAGIELVENPSANLTLSTCVDNVNEIVKAYKLPEGIKFSITSIDGSPISLKDDVHLFLKPPASNAEKCKGIATWKIPAGQIGASFLMDSKKVIFDPFQAKIWFYTK